MSGPLGGQPGAAPRGGKGPGQRRMLLKGLRMGSYVLVSYREKKGLGFVEERVDYEGTIVDKRVGWDNRESYVELKDCIRLTHRGEIAVREGKKRLFDAFIEDCEVVEKSERPLTAELSAAEGAASGDADPAAAASSPAAALQMAGVQMAPMMQMVMPMAAGMPMGMGGMMVPCAGGMAMGGMALPGGMAMGGMAMPCAMMQQPAAPAAAQASAAAPEAPRQRSRSRSRGR